MNRYIIKMRIIIVIGIVVFGISGAYSAVQGEEGNRQESGTGSSDNLLIDGFEGISNWEIRNDEMCTPGGKFELSDEMPKFGNHSFKLTCPVVPAGKYPVALKCRAPREITGSPQVVAIWVKANGKYNFGLIFIDKTSESHVVFVQNKRVNEWEMLAADLSTTGYWGGDNNGRIDYPLFLWGVHIEKSEEERKDVLVFLDNISCVEP